MKKYIILLLTFFVYHSYSSQINEDKKKEIEIDLKEIAISNPPSIILLGISPSELETSKSKKAVVLSLVNSFKENGGIPDTYAFEITPYWLLPSKNMNSLRYAGYNEKTKRQNIFNEIKKTSVSLGFVRDLSLVEDDNIRNPAFSISVRGNLIKIRTKENLKNILSEDSLKKAKLNIISKYLNEQENLRELEKKCIDENLSDSDCEKLLTDASTISLQEYNESENQSKNIDYYRNLLEASPLLALDFAGGYSTFFSDNKFSNNQFGKLGFWMTLNTGFDFTDKQKTNVEKKLNFYGIARYLEDGTTLNANQQFLRTKNFDFGGKAEFVYNRFSISYEYIYRVNDLENTFRSSGLLAYKVSDKVYINAAFGKNYGDRDNLISFLGLNWGLDSERKSVFIENEK